MYLKNELRYLPKVKDFSIKDFHDGCLDTPPIAFAMNRCFRKCILFHVLIPVHLLRPIVLKQGILFFVQISAASC